MNFDNGIADSERRMAWKRLDYFEDKDVWAEFDHVLEQRLAVLDGLTDAEVRMLTGDMTDYEFPRDIVYSVAGRAFGASATIR